MQKYPIVINRIPGLPQDLYRNGTYEGVVAHCTANPNRAGGNTPTGERSYLARTWDTPDLERFFHYAVGVENGQAIILQVADPTYKAWGAGGTANQRYVHVEMCMYDDPEVFNVAYDAYCFIIAKSLFDKKLGVTPATPVGGGTLWTHEQVSYYLGDTDHVDPVEYLKSHGISINQFVTHIRNYYQWLSTPTPTQDEPSEYAKASWDKACNFVTPSGQTAFDGTNPRGSMTREMLAVILDRMGLLM